MMRASQPGSAGTGEDLMETENFTRRAFVKGALALSALSFLSPVAAWAASWQLLGTRTVLLQNDTDIVPVTFVRGPFTHLQLRVKGNGVYMNAIRVTFSNRQTVNLPVRNFIPAGGQTRPLDLPGNRRFISFVQLEYRSQANARGRATVELWGRQ
jgi:hypothetical protein